MMRLENVQLPISRMQAKDTLILLRINNIDSSARCFVNCLLIFIDNY